MKIILGSSSPRRKELLSLLSGNFTVMKPEIDESPLPGELPQQYSERITQEKAESLSGTLPSDSLLICADTIVTIHNRILGKPSSLEEALTMLMSLSDKVHTVMTSLVLLHSSSDSSKRMLCSTEKTMVHFKRLSERTALSYLDKINYQDKAGSYAIQEHGSMLIKSVSGSASNVMGFPMSLFLQEIEKLMLFTYFFNFSKNSETESEGAY